MDNRTGLRAVTDSAAAVAAFLAVGIWVSTASPGSRGLRYLALAAGTALIGQAVASILRRRPRISTSADRVTLVRAVLVACCATVAVPGLVSARPPGFLFVLLGAVAFVLDAVDGRVARRSGCSSPAGARLDNETDAALVLVLSCAAAPTIGLWTLGTGALRYLFVAAGWFRPSLKQPLPESRIRKGIGAFQPLALLVALTPGVPAWLGTPGAAFALLLLVLSFCRDVVELERRGATPTPGRRRRASQHAGQLTP